MMAIGFLSGPRASMALSRRRSARFATVAYPLVPALATSGANGVVAVGVEQAARATGREVARKPAPAQVINSRRFIEGFG